LLEPGDWLVQAVSVPAFESLSALAARAASGGAGSLSPDDVERRRAEAHARGLPLAGEVHAALTGWADRLGVAATLA
jgi:hypothetical protein